VVLHAWVSAGRGTPSGRRGDEHAHALGSVAVGAANGMNIVPKPRRHRRRFEHNSVRLRLRQRRCRADRLCAAWAERESADVTAVGSS
jgi:hypothetical protein